MCDHPPLIEFQSTLPRRERPSKGSSHKANTSISIHAPAKGATSSVRRCRPWTHHFNPRSREGSDCGRVRRLSATQRFQSTLPRRERPKSTVSGGIPMVFQSTLPRRERLATLNNNQLTNYFNPRSREGSDRLAPVSLTM